VRRSYATAAVVAASLAAFGAAVPAGAVSPTCSTVVATTTCTFTSTGAGQTFAVPAAVSSLDVDVFGAQGGAGNFLTGTCGINGVPGGKGGEALATVAVTPGQALRLLVGVAGRADGGGGFNGGGIGGGGFAVAAFGGGGGASDVRAPAPFGLAERLIVAGGGGGTGECDAGGAGGGANGGDADGHGGTQIAGGTSAGNSFAQGTVGQGGSGTGGQNTGGGGGGGLYGGGAGFRGGGGGSGFGPSGVVFHSGVHEGDGLITVSYTPQTLASLCALTKAAFGPGIMASSMCATLDQAQATPGLKRLLLASYKQRVQDGVALRLISQAQANALLAFANTL